MRAVFLMIIAAALISPFPSNASAGPLEELAELQKTVKSVKAPFRQEKHTELLPRPIKSKGTFYYKDGRGVRWVYDGQMVVIYDNRYLYLHYTELKEAEKLEGIAGFSGPLSFNIIELLRDYEVDSSASGEEGIVLSLVPRQKMPFTSMRMLFRKGEPFPHEVRVYEETGDETVISFIDTRTNVKLKDGLFSFEPPRGVKLRERSLK